MRRSEIVVNNGRLYHIGLGKEHLKPNVIFVGDPARAYRVSARFDSVEAEVKNREYVTLTGKYKGMPLMVMGTGIGTDNVEIAMGELYSLNEFNFDTGMREPDTTPLTIIRVGTSGGVQPAIAPGVLGIASYALGLDNTGFFYNQPPADNTVSEIEKEAYKILTDATPSGSRFRGKIYPYASKASPDVVSLLSKKAEVSGAEYIQGITVSSPGFYGPSGRFLDGLEYTIPEIKLKLAELMVEKRQIINFEMESSLLFHLAAQMGYRAGTICPIISNPKTSDAIPDYKPHVENSITIALDSLVDLYSEN